MKKLIIYLAIVIYFAPNSLFSQEIKANVMVSMEQLSDQNRMNVQTMEQDITRYINNQRFTGQEWSGPPIPVDISILLSGGTNNVYSAKVIIFSKRTLDGPSEVAGTSIVTRFIDTKWSFLYNLGASLTYNPLRFDNFTSLLDFYMLLVIGYDKDSYGELEGAPLFEQARNIFLLGASNSSDGYETTSQPGEITRYNLVNELADMRFHDLRKLIFAYYVDGLDLMGFPETREKALKNIADVINEMAAMKETKFITPSLILQNFFDAKANEIALLFNGYNDTKLFQNLKYLNPSNTMLYEDAKDGKLNNNDQR